MQTTRRAPFLLGSRVRTQTYANGGNSDAEHFGRAGLLHLSDTNSETCNSYNMLKLTAHLFEWEPRRSMRLCRARVIQHIPGHRPIARRVHLFRADEVRALSHLQPADRSFWCCVGTGMENHTKYAQSIYYHDAHSLYVNLFIPSELSWTDSRSGRRRIIPQAGKCASPLWPDPHITDNPPAHPGWAGSGLTISVNGSPFNSPLRPAPT